MPGDHDGWLDRLAACQGKAYDFIIVYLGERIEGIDEETIGNLELLIQSVGERVAGDAEVVMLGPSGDFG